MASLRRLGAVSLSPSLPCKSTSRKGVLCNQPFGQDDIHFDLCQVGGGRLRPHGAQVAALGRQCRMAGAFVDIERVVPDLAAWTGDDDCTDAIMDLVCWWPGRVNQYLIDVTIRSPHAARYSVTEDITSRASRETFSHNPFLESGLVLPAMHGKRHSLK